MWSVPDVKHVSGTYLRITGGSGEIRTRDQRIKRSQCSSKPHINQWSTRLKKNVRLSVRLLFGAKFESVGRISSF